MDVATRERLDHAVDHGAVRMLHESRFLGSFGDGAGNIHDDGAAVLVLLAFLRWEMEFVFDGREGGKEEIAGVSHDGTAAGRDLVSGEKFVESTEDVADVHGRMEVLDATDESFGEVTRVLLEANSSVAEAKAGLRIRECETKGVRGYGTWKNVRKMEDRS